MVPMYLPTLIGAYVDMNLTIELYVMWTDQVPEKIKEKEIKILAISRTGITRFGMKFGMNLYKR